MGQTADELLEALTADPAVEGHIVVGSDRFITVPDELKRIAVQFDHNVETVTFDCPRYWDGIDMSIMRIYINYMRPDNVKGTYVATDVSIDNDDPNMMHFNWTISKDVTMAKGSISFLVCITKINEDGNEVNHWNSELNRELTVSEGLECQEVIAAEYADVISELLERMDHLTGAVNGELLEDILDEQDALKNDNAVINNSLTALQGRVSAAETDILELEAGLAETNVDVKGLDTRVLTNELAIGDLKDRVSTNETDISVLQNKMNDLESNGVVGAGDFTELENRVAANEISIKTLQTDTSAMLSDINTHTTDINNLAAAITNIEENLTAIVSTDTF